MARQIGSDHAMGLRQIGNHPHPFGGVFSRPMQQDDWRAVATRQHSGRNAGEFQSPFGDGHPRQQPFASLLADKRPAVLPLREIPNGRLRLNRGHRVLPVRFRGLFRKSTLGRNTEAPLRRDYPFWAARGMGSFAQRILDRLRSGCADTRRPLRLLAKEG
jgi:hypothetical protein